mmetsp:Transcript_25099/g.32425  ORF Transcript_25099/g.32425 Transcript_25099/m.32425 type:complete len:430 (+) Transcript_25099:82-1371(+)
MMNRSFVVLLILYTVLVICLWEKFTFFGGHHTKEDEKQGKSLNAFSSQASFILSQGPSDVLNTSNIETSGSSLLTSTDILDDSIPTNLEAFPTSPLSIKEARMCDDELHIVLHHRSDLICPEDPTCMKCAKQFDKASKIKEKFTSKENERRRSELFSRVFPSGVPIVTMAVNEGQLYLFLNWFCSCLHINIDPRKYTYMIPTDKGSHDVLVENGFHVEPLTWMVDAGVKISPTYDGLANAYGHTFINSVVIFGIGSLIEKKYPVLYSDVDLVWLRDPIPFLLEASQQRDILGMHSQWKDATGPLNTGFAYISPSFKSQIFIKTLENLTLVKIKSDQQLWNKAIRHTQFRQLVYRSLPRHLFNLFWFPDKPPAISNETYVMHALSLTKAQRFRKYGYWYFNESCAAYDQSIDEKVRKLGLYDFPEPKSKI